MIEKTTREKLELKKFKLNWRESMRRKYGDEWTKKKAHRLYKDGQRRMN